MEQKMWLIGAKAKWLKLWLPAWVDLTWMGFTIDFGDEGQKQTYSNQEMVERCFHKFSQMNSYLNFNL